MKLVGFSWFSYRNALVKSNCTRYPGLTLGHKPYLLPWVANYWGLGDLLYLAAKRPAVGTKKEVKYPVLNPRSSFH